MVEELLREPIYREDLERELEYAKEGWRNAYNFYVRARHQGAPQPLLNALSQASDTCAALYRQYEALLGCFPQEPR